MLRDDGQGRKSSRGKEFEALVLADAAYFCRASRKTTMRLSLRKASTSSAFYTYRYPFRSMRKVEKGTLPSGQSALLLTRDDGVKILIRPAASADGSKRYDALQADLIKAYTEHKRKSMSAASSAAADSTKRVTLSTAKKGTLRARRAQATAQRNTLKLSALTKAYENLNATTCSRHDHSDIFEKVFASLKGSEPIAEIARTELDYVHHLKKLVEEYQLPLSPILSRDEMAAIFLNVEVLLKANTELLQLIGDGLRDLLARCGEKIISLQQVIDIYAKAFLMLMPYFKIYAQYCAELQFCALRIR